MFLYRYIKVVSLRESGSLDKAHSFHTYTHSILLTTPLNKVKKLLLPPFYRDEQNSTEHCEQFSVE